MSSRRAYSYSILRYVHDVVTGEFVNIGIVFFAPATPSAGPVVKYDFKDRIGRIRGMFPDLDRDAFQAAVHSLRRRASGVAKEAEKEDLFSDFKSVLSVAHRILPHDGSALRWAEAGTGIASDLDATFQRISHRMVGNYDKRHESRRTDDDVWRPVRQALHDRHVPIEFEPKAIIGSVDIIEFKHSWKNGKVHAYEPLSFDLADAENIKDKARRWMGHLSAAHIGSREDFKAYFIAGQPSDQTLMPAYLNAIEILRNAPGQPEVYEEGDLDRLVDMIEDDYRHHIAAG